MYEKNFERLEKTVKVTDPWRWYGEDTVDISLYVMNYKDTTTVRIVVHSIDDFSVAYNYECESKYKDQIKYMYNHMKNWMFDKIPNEINVAWLYEHGYLPN